MDYQLEELIAIYGEKLLRYATSILYNHQDAEDVVQDVFESLYRRCSLDQRAIASQGDSLIPVYQQEAICDSPNLSAWLYKVTYNKSINIIRRRRFIVFGDIPENTVAPEITGFSDEILYALGKLLPEERALLYGRILEGYSYEELSEQMGKSPATLRKRYERAKKKLAKYMNPSHARKGVPNEQISNI